MGHIAYPRDISQQLTNLSKAVNIKTGWLRVVIISLGKRLYKLEGIQYQIWLKLAQWIWGFLNVVNVFLLLRNYIPTGKDVALQLHDYPSTKSALCQVWLKLTQWFGRKRFLNIVNEYSLFCYNFLFKESVPLLLIKHESTLPMQRCLCQVSLKLVQRVWRRSILHIDNVFLLFRYFLNVSREQKVF